MERHCDKKTSRKFSYEGNKSQINIKLISKTIPIICVVARGVCNETSPIKRNRNPDCIHSLYWLIAIVLIDNLMLSQWLIL